MIALLVGGATVQTPLEKSAPAVAFAKEVSASSTEVLLAESASKTNETNVRKQVETYFADIPVMQKIAWCESKFRHRDAEGAVVRGIVKSDVGVMQINEYYHRTTAERMGLELYDLEDNMAYARALYTKEGTRPWSSSEHCWGNPNVLAFVK